MIVDDSRLLSVQRTYPRRSALRLSDYDYLQEGSYFVTVCAWHRVCLFGAVIDDEICLNGVGRIVEQCWSEIPDHCPSVDLDEFVVMPNHVHGILTIVERDIRRASIPAIVGTFKAAVTRQVHAVDGLCKLRVWQRTYHEQVIRSEKALESIRRYVVNNPLKWNLDEENPDRQAGVSWDGGSFPG